MVLLCPWGLYRAALSEFRLTPPPFRWPLHRKFLLSSRSAPGRSPRSWHLISFPPSLCGFFSRQLFPASGHDVIFAPTTALFFPCVTCGWPILFLMAALGVEVALPSGSVPFGPHHSFPQPTPLLTLSSSSAASRTEIP